MGRRNLYSRNGHRNPEPGLSGILALQRPGTVSRSMRRRELPPPWRTRDEAIVGHIGPDDPFAGLREGDQPPVHVPEDGHERFARFARGGAQASANVESLAAGIGRRRHRNAPESTTSSVGGGDRPETGRPDVRPARTHDGRPHGRIVRVTRDRYGYRIDGAYFRRVSTLLGGLPKPALTGWAAKRVAEFAVEHKDAWTKLPDKRARELLRSEPIRTRDDAAERGTAIHAAIEHHLHGRPYPDDLTDEQLASAISAAAFLKEHVRRVHAVELTVFSRTHQYAGTLDLFFRDRDGHDWIVDWKTSRSVHVEHAIQLAAYHNAEHAVRHVSGGPDDWTGEVHRWGRYRAARLGIVHVRPDSATLFPVNLSERLWTVFRAAAHVKLWQLDTNAYRRAPRERVFGEPLDISVEGRNDHNGQG